MEGAPGTTSTTSATGTAADSALRMFAYAVAEKAEKYVAITR